MQQQTLRLQLRSITPADQPALLRVLGDPEVMRFSDSVLTADEVTAWIAQRCLASYATHGFGPYGVVRRDTGDMIGYCGLFYFADLAGSPAVELGYRLERAAWGHGYATEAAQAVCTYAFTTLALPRLVALIDPGNQASLRVATKLGMQFVREVMLPGYTHPDHLYQCEQP
jgi:RimJ/RimL family protein N-acetyltransferase